VTPTTPVVVIDTNLLVRALTGGPGSSPLLQAWQAERIQTQLKNIDHKLPFKVGNDLERHQKGSFVCIPALAATSTIQSRSVPAHSPGQPLPKAHPFGALRASSGPLLDRIYIHVEMPRVDYDKLSSDRLGEPSAY
jgi:hypothetical protein